MNDHLKWESTKADLIHKCGIFDLYREEMISRTGKKRNFYILKAPDWVTVVPVVTKNNGQAYFIMVKQFRQGIRRITYEFPAGLREKKETPEAAAFRELEEETGYKPEKLTLIARIATTPAFMNNWAYTFVAENPGEKKKNKLDEFELLDVMEISVNEVINSIGSGPYINSQTIASLHFYQKWLKEKGAERIRTDA
ncbi:MAG: NUDIX hydrolase [Spirochaetales bacterium]|nr:NUDIX hydrolase [Spirochaetales bacterium]